MKLKWSTTALKDLERIGDFIAEDNASAANRFVSRLWKRAKALKKHPQMGRIVPETERVDIRELIEGNYRIVYQVDKTAVIVIAVTEGHRLLKLEKAHD